MNTKMIDSHELSFLFHEYRKDLIEHGYERQYDGCVYALYNPLTGLTKIGRSYNCYRRLRELVTQSGCSLKCVAIGFNEVEMDLSIELIEKYLHNYYKSYRVVGEWFMLRKTQLFCLANFLCWDYALGSTCCMTNDEDANRALSIKKINTNEVRSTKRNRAATQIVCANS
jgi:hypothetical protein